MNQPIRVPHNHQRLSHTDALTNAGYGKIKHGMVAKTKKEYQYIIIHVYEKPV
jgi:hypothetical protein